MTSHFITITPLLVAAVESMLSVPVPALPMIDKFDASITSDVTFVADLTMSPSCFYNKTTVRCSNMLLLLIIATYI